MHDARAIANFFLGRARNSQLSLTIMTLLKVLYFAHAWHLAKYSRPLIAQPFEAWRHGPVNRVVYEQYKGYRDKPLDKLAVAFDPRRLAYMPVEAVFSSELTVFLQNIFDYYAKFHPFDLSSLTHEKGGPWDAVWSEASRRAVPGMIIPNDLIQRWFTTHQALYWTDRERGRLT
jgi:uncharacterized phage-associated protein